MDLVIRCISHYWRYSLIIKWIPIIRYISHYQMDSDYQMDYVPVGERYAVESCVQLSDLLLIIRCIFIIRCISHYQMDAHYQSKPIIK
jgi:hypothetical protein